MTDAGVAAAIINTGSKQGITAPPGDTAYNVSKAAIKTLTEGLQHTLRNMAGCQVSAHLLVPGSTFTGMTRRRLTEKPPGAWTAEQVADFMLATDGCAGDFYIICPDNEVTPGDGQRHAWPGRAGYPTFNRPWQCRAGAQPTPTPSPNSWPKETGGGLKSCTVVTFGCRLNAC